jgi:hypothetical protein
MRRYLLPSLVLLVMASRLPAQEVTQTGSPTLLKYGKWGLLAGSLAMHLAARHAHERADEEFAIIQETCSMDRSRCTTLPDGSYADPVLEQHYQNSLDYDSKATAWLIGGETALVGAAVGFIWELTRSRGRPKNIPFEPEVSERNGITRLGFRVEF